MRAAVVSVDEARDAAPEAGGAVAAEARRPVGRVFANREYRGICLAQVTSECGDQISGLAVAYLVYTRSNSAFLAAVSYAVTYVPWVIGSVLLAPLVDRYPRRSVLLFCDLARAVLTLLLLAMTFDSRIPIAALLAVVLLASFCSPPFVTARSSTIPDIFEGSPLYVRAVATGRILQQVDQVFGFALGGIIVAAITPRGALAVDAATFVTSFLLILTHVRKRPAPSPVRGLALGRLLRNLGPDMRRVVADPARRYLVLACACALLFLIAPEGLAVAYVRQQGHGALAAGLLSAAQPCGVALGAWWYVRLPPNQQGRWLLRMPVIGAALLTLTAFAPPVWLTALIWLASGVTQCFVVTSIAAYNVITDSALRGRANGLASSSICLTQGLGFAVWGLVGDAQGAAAGVAWAGVAGLLLVSVLWYFWPDDALGAVWERLAVAERRD